MFYIEPKTFDICMNYTNTLPVEFLIEPSDASITISPFTDKVYVAIADSDGKVVFDKVCDIEAFVDGQGIRRYKWALALTYEQSKAILPGDYFWDFTYYQNAVITNDKPTGGSYVDTPFCEHAMGGVHGKAHFSVRDIISKP